MNILNFFKRELSDKVLFKTLGKQSYIRNGVGYGFISDEYLYHNSFIEVGIGRITSGYGDWGGGATHATTSPLKITIDKDYIIRKVECDYYSNSGSETAIEKAAEQLSEQLKVKSVFVIKDPEFKKHVDGILSVIPCKCHIGHDVFRSPHMLKYFMNTKERSSSERGYTEFPDANPKELAS